MKTLAKKLIDRCCIPSEVEKIVVTICEEGCMVGPETWDRYELRVVLKYRGSSSS